MRLWVIRHAEAVGASGRHDHERELSDAGRAQATRLGQYLARRSTATLIMSSPILRARQTAESILQAVPASSLRLTDALSTSGSAREAVEALRGLHAPECILVSHEPLTSQLVARLTAGDDSLHVRFTPATAVLLDLDRHERASRAVLIECVTPETLLRAT